MRRTAIIVALLTLTACGGGGGSGTATTPVPPVVPPAAPVVSLTASAQDVALNGTATLTWSSSNATACTATGGWTGSQATSGSIAVAVTQTQPQTYALACTGTGGSGSASVQLTGWNMPVVAVTADATDLLSGNVATISWTSQNAVSCVGSGGLASTQPLSGSMTTAALTATTVFTLTCSNPAFPNVSNATTVSVSPTMTLALTVQYQAPGSPILNAAQTYYVPNWASPVSAAVPFVYAELQDAGGHVVQSTFADQNGVASFAGLNPAVTYTPRFESRLQYPQLSLDFQVLDNTTASPSVGVTTFRGRYPVYSTTAAAYVPGSHTAHQTLAVTLPDGWNPATQALVDANRVAGPYALLATAAQEALIMSAAIGGSPVWRPLTILWSTANKGNKPAQPDNFDQGYVTGSGGFYSSGHGALDASGAASTTTTVSEDAIYLSGDPTFEAMELYPFVMSHEMGHFIQRSFSRSASPGGPHGFTDTEDARLAWGEGSASGIAALVLRTAEERRVFTASGQIIVQVIDIAHNTVNGNPRSWPIGWFQETTISNLMWAARDMTGSIALSPEAVLAPMFTAQWNAQPWSGTVWAYVNGLKAANAAVASQIDSWAGAHGIDATNDDVWGSVESHVGPPPTAHPAQDVLPPYTQIAVGQPHQVCTAGAPNDYNKAGNARYLRLPADPTPRTLIVQGPSGTIPDVLARGSDHISLGQNSVTVAAATSTAAETVVVIGDCSVMYSPFAADLKSCSSPAPPPAPPAEQCWTVTLQ